MIDRATASTIGVVLLLALAVVLAGIVGGVLFGTAAAPPEPTPAALSLTATADRLVLTHDGGATLDVGAIDLRVRVDGTELTHQPPVPFFSARGFHSGPTGPFNAAGDPEWTAGESASVAPAGTNAPALRPGATVEVRVVRNGSVIATLTDRIPENSAEFEWTSAATAA